MKKIIIIGLLAVSPLLALAGTPKTSKPASLSDTQMQAVKGQGTIVYTFVSVHYGTVTQQVVYIPQLNGTYQYTIQVY